MNARVTALASLLSLLSSAGCDESARTSAPMTLSFTVQDESEAPVRGASLWYGARQLGTSDEEGALEVALRLVPGEQAHFSRTCPRGYDPTAERRAVRVPDTSSRQAPRAPIALRMTCRSSHVETALVVRATTPIPVTLPIEVDGKRVGQTDSLGFAHVHLRAPAESELQVTLDTSAYPELRPQHPVRTFQLAQHDEILLFDQALERPPRTKRRRKINQPQPRPRRIR